ncbi:unnamed protein product [Amaranthus hypochondriacus]
MGKLLWDSATNSITENLPQQLVTWRDPSSTTVDSVPSTSWDEVPGLEDQQRRNLSRLYDNGILWTHPQDRSVPPVVLQLAHGGNVDSDGNCLFSALEKLTQCGGARELRRKAVKRFEHDLGLAENVQKQRIESVIKNLYSPDLDSGWGVHIVQEIKLLAKKSDRQIIDDVILYYANRGIIREIAAETIYKECCIAVDDGASWRKYMSISGSPDHDEYDIITMQYTKDGLLTINENRDGRAAAFGDDIAIECLANEFKREIYVVQAHGSDADNCVFFLPHRPRGEITGHPLFLFMKGTGWCSAGADHYEPLIAHSSSVLSSEKVAFVL